MDEVYGAGHVYVPRAHDEASDWLPRSSLLLDGLTGGQLVIAGNMPVVCSAGFDAPVAMNLLELAGLEPALTRVSFRAGESLAAISLLDPCAMLVFQHAFPRESPLAARSWIDTKLLSYLNNKGNLAELAPAEYVPPRRIVDRAEFFASAAPGLPIVMKAVTDQSSGGGFGVSICHTLTELHHAQRTFQSCHQLVIEDLLEIVSNPCLSFAVTKAGKSHYLGFADQDVTAGGRHRGNWIELGISLPESVVEPAMEVVSRAAAMGYRGFAGIDIAVTHDQQIYVLDLNFRLNASTACVLLRPALEEQLETATMHFRKIGGRRTADELASTLEPLVRSGHVIPLSLFDPAAAGYSNEIPFVHALIVGTSRQNVRAIEAELAQREVA